jgi:hypothetical protein
VTTLRALAPALLPGELGAAGHEKIVGDILQWLAAYRAGAERSWGYGHPRPSGTPAIDTTAYRAQLIEIESFARRRGGALSGLSADDRRAVALDALARLDVRSFPSAPNGQHVVTDFMSFFFTSSAAVDLCYRARIGSVTCRGLTGAALRPTSLPAG